MNRYLLLGASGFLGSAVAQDLVARYARGVTLHTHRSLQSPASAGSDATSVRAADLTEPRELRRLLDDVRPHTVVNCAALADVDLCEKETELADALNCRLPAQLADWTASHGAQLVHVSTDAVFNGMAGPYLPDSEPSPINFYGTSKLAGEVAVLAADPEALVVRTNLVGWGPAGHRGLLDYFVRRLSIGQPTPGWVDVLFRPLPTHWFWPGCERAIAAGRAGLLHLTGPQLLSKFDFGRRVAEIFHFDPRLVTLATSKDDRQMAPRPQQLDVVPSTILGELLTSDSLDQGLAELRIMRSRREGPS